MTPIRLDSTTALMILISVLAGPVLVRSVGEASAAPGKTEMKRHDTRSGRPAYSQSGHDVTPLEPAEIERLAGRLSPEEAAILLRKGTEPPFCGTLLDNKKEGLYVCRLCGLPLFSSADKFNSGTGWPSFTRSVDPDHVRYERDVSHGMVRTEIMCQRCGGHLGHVFEDGPAPTGLRYCLNSASMDFVEQGQSLPERSRPVDIQTAYFAGGCFWGVEDCFQQVPGVLEAISGYQGGRTESPSYQQVCTGSTGHAETVKVLFDPARVSYVQLLEYFFRFHDPTQVNQQGPDVGEQYRSVIFTVDAEQERQARAFIEAQEKGDRFRGRKIATQVVSAAKAGPFWEAEEYHQDYHLKHGGSCAIPSP